MKVRFTTVDIIAVLRELHEKVLGMRVVNVYDVDHKTYIIKIARSEEKAFIIFESGVRIHLTEFEWPKNMMPSGFSMKCRKHLKSRRLVAIDQLGVDRIIDMQYGSDEAAYHLIIELYDKGNVILTDHQYVILSLLRTRTDQEAETRFAVREVYPKGSARQNEPLPSSTRLQEILASHSASDQLRRILMPHFVYGAALLDHVLLGAGFDEGALIGDITDTLPRLQRALEEAEMIFQQLSTKQYQSCIIQKKHNNPLDHVSVVESSDLVINVEFHPIIYRQHESLLFTTYQSFNKAVDEFFSKLNIQKIDVKLHQQEKAGFKKLENVRKDHARRLQELERVQSEDCSKAELIELNIELVTKACDVINGAIASAMDWGDIVAMVKEARSHGDTVACAIHELQLERNHMILLLCNPYEDDKGKAVKVDIDLDLTAHANVRKYFDHKRFAVSKQQKTIDASSKALKSAEKKTKQALKEASKVATIKKARKVYWFEKFYWFISSENYLVIGGRDQQQNELLVKRYLTEGDVYVHADLHGASSIVIKNPTRQLVPSHTLSEAATMATCYSSAWEAKVTSSVWWVWHHQVSKTAPSGEYLTTGSFMIRGKKNYLPPSQLMLCFGFMFKLDEDSVSNHYGDRKIKIDDSVSMSSEVADVAMETIAMESDESSDNDLTAEDSSMITFPDTIIGLTSSHGYRPSKDVQDKVSLEPRGEKKTTRKPPNKEIVNSKQQPQQTVKRGQKYKQRKMRERYKDQDDEDRQLRMQLLASAGDTDKQSSGRNKKKNDKKGRNSASGQKHKYPRAKESNMNNVVEVTDKQQDPILMAATLASPDLQLAHQSNEILDHVILEQDHVTSQQDQVISEQDHVTSEQDHMTSQQDHVTPQHDPISPKLDHLSLEQDHITSEQNHMLPEQDHVISKQDHVVTSEQDHVISGQDHVTSGQDHEIVEDDHQCSDQENNQSDQEHNPSDQDDDDDGKDDITSLLDTLTGCPSNDDILLFAVPVCAPYLAMTPYKYKVKFIPGIQKRGKAARTSLHNFTHSKEVTARERDLLLSVKDNDLSRYFPGKVKLLATNPSATTKHK